SSSTGSTRRGSTTSRASMFGLPSRPRRTRSGSRMSILRGRPGTTARPNRYETATSSGAPPARAPAGELRWVLSAYPTEAAAQDASMSLPEYEDFVFGAAFLDDPNPVARWQEFGERLGGLAGVLWG